MQSDMLIEIRTCATSQHPPHPESGRCLPGFRPGHSVCGVNKGVFFRCSHIMSVSSLIAAAACVEVRMYGRIFE
jgi:hypothetical protein